MTNEGQYHSQIHTTQWRDLMDYGAERLRESWFRQATFKQPVYAPADRIGQIMNTQNDLAEAYFKHSELVTVPKKVLVSRRLYSSITKMPGFNENTNRLHFYHQYQLAAGYKPTLHDPNHSVYVQIDPTRAENEYTFQ